MIKKIVRNLFRLILSLIVLLTIWMIWQRELVSYGWMQFKGQMHIVTSSRDVEDVLNDPAVSDSLKKRLVFTESIRRYAIDSLGMKESKNYTSFYDHGSNPLQWVLTASEPYELKAYHWKFPVVGNVSYKGFFVKERGLAEESELRAKGYDTDLGEVSAWSTLGWFRDPILSGMLKRSNGHLAELLIHEMTHATLYIKSDVNFNENFASAVGEMGAEQFLRFFFRENSLELKRYLGDKSDSEKYIAFMLQAASNLDSLYKGMKAMHDSVKYRLKLEMMHEIVKGLDTVVFISPGKYHGRFTKKLPDNTYFLNFVRYDAQKSAMKKELKEIYKDNIPDYIRSMKERYN